MTDKVLDKIHKLMKLAQDERGNTTERDTALRQAHALMAKHNLEMIDVERASGQATEPRESQSTRMSIYPWARSIAHSVAQLFFCAYYFQRTGASGKQADHHFIGRQSNAITANELAAYVVSSVFKELRHRFGSDTSPSARSFATGVADEIRARCWQLRTVAAKSDDAVERKNALVLASLYDTERTENDNWIAANVGDLKASKDRAKDVNAGAYHQGKAHGKGISLAQQLGATKSNVKRLK